MRYHFVGNLMLSASTSLYSDKDFRDYGFTIAIHHAGALVLQAVAGGSLITARKDAAWAPLGRIEVLLGSFWMRISCAFF
jgi:hypothetical protein